MERTAEAVPALEVVDTRLLLGPTLDLQRAHIQAQVRVASGSGVAAAEAAVRQLFARDPYLNGTLAASCHAPEDTPTAWALFAKTLIAVQRRCASAVSHWAARTVEADTEGIAYVEWEDAETAMEAIPIVSGLLSAALQERLPDPSLEKQLTDFVESRAGWAMDPNSRLLLAAARSGRRCALNLSQPPFEPAEASARIRNGLVQVGAGAGQRRFLGSLESIAAQAIGPFLRSRRHLAETLKAAGAHMPASAGAGSLAGNAAQAIRIATAVGYPAVLRPPSSTPYSDSLVASRVIGPLRTDAEVQIAFDTAFGTRVKAWVERYVPGAVWRALVLDGRLVTLFELGAPTVLGDGTRSVGQLLNLAAEKAPTERDHRAWSELRGNALLPLHLHWQGRSLDHIPAAGQTITLDHPRASFAQPGAAEPDGALRRSLEDLATRVALAVRVPLVAVDIVQSPATNDTDGQGLVVVSVTPEPDITTRHIGGPPNDHEIARMLIGLSPPRALADRAPIVAVTGSSGKTTTTTLITAIFRQAGLRTGWTTSIGCYVEDSLLEEGDLAGLPGSYQLLAMPDIQAFALESARGGMITIGRGFDWCDVGICLNLTEDHIGEDGLKSLDDLAAVKADVVRHARRAAVLNADDPYCLAMTADVPVGTRTIFFSRDAQHPELQRHLAAGEVVVYPGINPEDKREWITVAQGSSRLAVVATADMPLSHGGAARFNVDNAMAAVAASHALDVPPVVIADALRAFRPDYQTLPGRLTELTGLPFRVILDTPKNILGFAALAAFAERQPRTGKRILSIAVHPRFSADVARRMTLAIAGSFDIFLLRPHRRQYTTDYGPEPFDLCRQTLLEAGVAGTAIEVFDDPSQATRRAFDLARAGDILVVLAPPAGVLTEGHWEEMQAMAAALQTERRLDVDFGEPPA